MRERATINVTLPSSIVIYETSLCPQCSFTIRAGRTEVCVFILGTNNPTSIPTSQKVVGNNPTNNQTSQQPTNKQPTNQTKPINQPNQTKPNKTKPTHQSTKPFNQPAGQTTNQRTKQSNQSTSWPANQPTNQTINQQRNRLAWKKWKNSSLLVSPFQSSSLPSSA